MRPFTVVLLGALLALSVGCSRSSPEGAPSINPPGVPVVEGVPRSFHGIRYIDIAEGTGSVAEQGQCVYLHYVGWLADGRKFESSRDSGKTVYGFRLGAGYAIAGWDRGVPGMKVGGKRRLLVPPRLGYGSKGFEPVIPPNSTLVFDVELMAVKNLPKDEDGRPLQCEAWEDLDETDA